MLDLTIKGQPSLVLKRKNDDHMEKNTTPCCGKIQTYPVITQKGYKFIAPLQAPPSINWKSFTACAICSTESQKATAL